MTGVLVLVLVIWRRKASGRPKPRASTAVLAVTCSSLNGGKDGNAGGRDDTKGIVNGRALIACRSMLMFGTIVAKGSC
jgi:hypothetical protein